MHSVSDALDNVGGSREKNWSARVLVVAVDLCLSITKSRSPPPSTAPPPAPPRVGAGFFFFLFVFGGSSPAYKSTSS